MGLVDFRYYDEYDVLAMIRLCGLGAEAYGVWCPKGSKTAAGHPPCGCPQGVEG
jgi:hypothetical protein